MSFQTALIGPNPLPEVQTSFIDGPLHELRFSMLTNICQRELEVITNEMGHPVYCIKLDMFGAPYICKSRQTMDISWIKGG